MRLINADALKVDINKRVTQYRHGDKPMPTIEDIINEQQVIEAEPVVRCKDCVYYEHEAEVVRCHDCKHYTIAKNGCNGICREWDTSTYTWDYCSKGERKDGEENG